MAKTTKTYERTKVWKSKRKKALIVLEEELFDVNVKGCVGNDELSSLYYLESRVWSLRAELSAAEGNVEKAHKESQTSTQKVKLAKKVEADQITDRLAELEAAIAQTGMARGKLSELDKGGF